MKGIALITIGLIGIIISGTILLTGVVFLLSFKYHLDIILKFEYDKSFSDLATLSLTRLNYNATYPSYKLLSEREINGFDEEMKDFLYKKTELLTGSNCFHLVNSTATILPPKDCQPVDHSGSIILFKPYNPSKLAEEIILTYNEVKR